MSAPEGAAPARQTWDQKRATAAWDRIRAVQILKEGEARDYARAAKQTSTRILTGGLGQALAFLLAKAAGSKQSPLRRLYDDLSGWVLTGRGISSNGEHLLDGILHGDTLFLRRATDETLAYLGWLIRFAEAEGLYKGNASGGSAREG